MNTTPLVLGTILASLTACTPPSKIDDSPLKDSDTDTEPDTDTDTTTYKGSLDASQYPECDGNRDSWSGPCCVDIYCIPRTDATCADPDALTAEEVTGEVLGSGSCECAPVDGPWQVQGEDGCCYLVGVQSCTGRPLPVDGQQRLASVVRGRRWARV
jgi:hypothetical protein